MYRVPVHAYESKVGPSSFMKPSLTSLAFGAAPSLIFKVLIIITAPLALGMYYFMLL